MIRRKCIDARLGDVWIYERGIWGRVLLLVVADLSNEHGPLFTFKAMQKAKDVIMGEEFAIAPDADNDAWKLLSRNEEK